MSDDVWAPLAVAIERGDEDAVVALLEPLDEPARRRLSGHAQRALKRLPPESFVHEEGESWEDYVRQREVHTAARTAVFGTSGSAAAAQARWLSPAHERLVRQRSREWRQDWAERSLATVADGQGAWAAIHRLVRDGLIERPQAIGYVTCAPSGMYTFGGSSLATTLRSEREWLDTMLWHFFTVEDVGLTSKDPHQSWSDALCELAADGTLDRDRLLDESLAALRRDFSPHNARWYAKFHAALKPTPEERRARLDELLPLLASTDPAIVGFAVRALEHVEDVPADRFVEAVAPALLCPVKGHAARAVKLTGRVATKPDVLIDALAHDARDVQELALTLIERNADALDDRERLATFAAEVDPALRPRVQALANLKGPGPLRFGRAVEVPGRRPPAATSWLTEPLQPPRDVAELLDRAAVALERGDDPDELELVLDGIGRFRDAEVDPGRARALLERAHTLCGPWVGAVIFSHARDALAFALFRWLEDEPVALAPTGVAPREAIAMRIREFADDLGPLLSAPTHKGGWIDPRIAVERTGTRELDLAQMVLRLAPEHREEALVAARPGTVLHYALGGEGERRAGPAWDAAEQARDPSRWRWPPRHVGDDADDALTLDDKWLVFLTRRLRDVEETRAHLQELPEATRVDPASPADLVRLAELWWWEKDEIERWLTTVWPANREGVYELVARRMWRDSSVSEPGTTDVLEVLLDPREPIRAWAALAVALALGHSQIEIRTLGVDVAIAALRDRRLDGAGLGVQLAYIVREDEWAVPARTAASLADVAAASPLHAHHTQVAIETALAGAQDRDRRQVLGLVDLLRRLAVEADAAVANEAAREWLGALSKGSKIGRAGREALAVTGDGAARSRAVVEKEARR